MSLPTASIRETLTLQGVETESNIAQIVGSTDDVYRLADRILELHPQALLGHIAPEEALFMAQLALVTGATVLTDDAEVKVYQKNNGERVIMLSVFYYQRRAREAGGVMYYPETREMTASERQMYQVQSGDVAVLCRGIAFRDLERLRGIDMPMTLILGDSNNPAGAMSTGWAVVTREEMDSSRPETGGTWRRTAERRAEKHLLKKLFGLPDPRLHVGQTLPAIEQVLAEKKKRVDDMFPKDYSTEDFNRDFFGYED